MTRVVIGGFAGGVVLFLWEIAAWTMLPLHTTSIRQLPYEESIVQAFRAYVKQPGFYLFPAWTPQSRDQTTQDLQEYRKVWTAKVRRGPVGTLAIRPQGDPWGMPVHLLVGFVTQTAAAMIAAWIVFLLKRGFFVRLLVVTLLGVFASVAAYVPQWNWMAVPTDHLLAMGADLVIGWFAAGIVLAAIVRRPSA